MSNFLEKEYAAIKKELIFRLEQDDLDDIQYLCMLIEYLRHKIEMIKIMGEIEYGEDNHTETGRSNDTCDC